MDGIVLSFTNDVTGNLIAICLTLIHDIKIIQHICIQKNKIHSQTNTNDHTDKLLLLNI